MMSYLSIKNEPDIPMYLIIKNYPASKIKYVFLIHQ